MLPSPQHEVDRSASQPVRMGYTVEPQPKRRRLNDGDSQRALHANQYGSTTVTGQASAFLGNKYETHNYYCEQGQKGEAPEAESTRQKMLVDSLTFKRMDARLHNIAPALPKTCKWLFRHDAFLAWNDDARMEEHKGFLWIKGKPGCGKSTIIKAALEAAKRNRSKKMCVTVSYFFNARAPGVLEKSTLGLYRSLAHQILQIVPSFASTFDELFSWKSNSETMDWTVIELQGFLVEVVRTVKRPSLSIFIDALDEGDENDIRALISFLENLTAYADGCPTLRICLSSRHYPHITIKKGLSLIVERQREHDQDIEVYVQDKLIAVDDV